MAIFLFKASVISRSGGGSALESAAYRHKTQMRLYGGNALNAAAYNHGTQLSLDGGDVGVGGPLTKDYKGKEREVVWSEVAVPDDAPEIVHNAFGEAAFLKARAKVVAAAEASGLSLSDQKADRKAWAQVVDWLWFSVERNEDRVNRKFATAQFARSLIIGLPVELSREAQIALMQGYIKAAFTDRGMIADWVMHDKEDGNPHVHVMLTLRDLAPDGWGLKNRSWNAKSMLEEWRADWAAHANLMLEREGFSERIDHRSYEAQGIYLEPEGHNPHVAASAERAGEEAREKARVRVVKEHNTKYLREHPEHILLLLQARQTVFTHSDVVAALRGRLLNMERADAEVVAASILEGDEVIPLVQRSPRDEIQYVTRARAYSQQRLDALSREMASSELALGAEADRFEAGQGPILVVPEEMPEEAAAAAAETKKRHAARRAKRGRGQETPMRGPSAAVVREALKDRADDLFRVAFGEPVRAAGAEWRAKENEALAMQMQGPRRGLWMDHTAGQGGDLLDLVAIGFCGLSEAKSDFQAVLKEAASYCGLSQDGGDVDMSKFRAQQDVRKQAAEAAERREAARKAALVRALQERAQPVENTPAAIYLEGRGITGLPAEGLAFLPPVPGQSVRSPEYGALVVWARDDSGAITGGQRILLKPDGSRPDVEVRKPAFGSTSGHPARFAGREPGGPLIVAEGPESALSIWAATGYETWAVFGVSGWKTAPLPKDREVIFAPDRDAPDSPAGKAFRSAVEHHLAAGVNLRIAVAPEPSGSKHDLNDTLVRAGPDAVRAAIASAREARLLLSADLNEMQRRAAAAMLSPARLTLVTGHAGTGKTFTIRQAALGWRERGYAVLGGAMSGKATQELGGIEEIEAATLAAWEARWNRGERPPERFVFIMDEAGMTGVEQWRRIQTRVAGMGGKLIAVGDPDQLQPVADLAGWWTVEQAAGQGVVIGTVIRQKDLGDRAATEALARDDTGIRAAIRHYVKKGAVRLEEAVRKKPIEALADAYYGKTPDDGQSRLALAWTRRDAYALNEAIRSRALARGVVERAGQRLYGEIERITRVNGRLFREAVELRLAVGDRVVLTRTHRESGLPRSSFGTVTANYEDEIDFLADGAEAPVTLDLRTFRHLDYGYAATVHRSQGVTVDQAFVLSHKLMHRHGVYVALSRHRENVTVFGRKDHVENMGDLMRLALASGHLEVETPEDGEASRIRSGQMVRPVFSVDIDGRVDWRGHTKARQETGLLGDMSLVGVAERAAGLLSSDYTEGDPILREDGPEHYATAPQAVIDDLIARQSVIRGEEIAARLSRAIAEPETFLRLFGQAMRHPDLIMLAEGDDATGQAAAYTTRSQLQLELEAVDRGARLALSDAPDAAPKATLATLARQDRELAREMEEVLNAGQRAALEHGFAPGRLRLIRGEAGSGKSRLAARLGALHEQAGWQAFTLSPTGAGLDTLRAEGAVGLRTLRGLTAALEAGRVQLDPATLVILDDAGRLGGREATDLLARIEVSGAKLVAFLDDSLQAPMEAGPVFRAVEMRVGAARLDGDHARRPERAALVRGLVRGGDDGLAALEKLTDEGAVVVGGDARQAADVLAEGWLADDSTDKIALAWSRAGAEAITAAIRARLDESDLIRAAFEADADGPLAGLKPGDRIRFLATTPWQPKPSDEDAPQPVVRAGETAVVLGRNEAGGLILRITGREEAREETFTADMAVPDWRFDFASTIHGAMGQGHDSVHLLASAGMSRQVLAAGAALHREHLRIVAPTTEARSQRLLKGVLGREADANGVLDYGFEPGLGAREAMRGRSVEMAPGGIEAALVRLRGIAGLDASGQEALPRGTGAEVLAEVIGAAILAAGRAPEGGDRLAVERYVRDLSDPPAWRALLRQAPKGLVKQADGLARQVAGVDEDGRLLTVARSLARGALMARALGEDAVAALFEDGLQLYGRRAEMARLSGRTSELVPTPMIPAAQAEWPDPADRPMSLKADREFRRMSRPPARRRAPRPGSIAWMLSEPSEEALIRYVLMTTLGIGGRKAFRRAESYRKARTDILTAARDRSPAPEPAAAKVPERVAQPAAAQEMAPAAVAEATPPPSQVMQRELALETPAPKSKRAATRTRAATPLAETPVADAAETRAPAVAATDYPALAGEWVEKIVAGSPADATVRSFDLRPRLKKLLEQADRGPWGQAGRNAEDLAARAASLPGLEGDDLMIAQALGRALSPETAPETEQEAREPDATGRAPQAGQGAEDTKTFALESETAGSPPTPAVGQPPAGLDFAGMGLQLAVAISARVNAKDPIHNTPDLADHLAADLMRTAGELGKRCPRGTEALARASMERSSVFGFAKTVKEALGTVLEGGPLVRLDTLRRDRVVFLDRVIDGKGSDKIDDAALSGQMASFTRSETAAMAMPDAPWPNTLPAAAPEKRAEIAAAFKALAVPGEAGGMTRAGPVDFGGMGLQLAQAISARVDVKNNVHNTVDLADYIAVMLAQTETGMAPDAPRTLQALAKAYVERPPHLGFAKEMKDAVRTALAEGPPEPVDRLRRDRAAFINRVIWGEVSSKPDAALSDCMTAFTHIEIHAMADRQAKWPESLPAVSPTVRTGTAEAFAELAEKRKEKIAMEQMKGMPPEQVREELVKGMALGRVTGGLLEQVQEHFTLDEIAALQDPATKAPDTLPALTPALRTRIAETLKRAAAAETRAPSDQGGAGRSRPVQIDRRYADAALQLASVVSERIEASDPVHRLPLLAATSQLLARADAARDLPEYNVEKLALGIARDRKTMEAKIALAKELVAKAPPPHEKSGRLPETFDEAIFRHNLSGRAKYENHPMQFNLAPMRDQYTAEVEGRVDAVLREGFEPTPLERLAAKAALLPGQPEGYAHIAKTLVAALREGQPRDVREIAQERQRLPAELAAVDKPDLEVSLRLLERLHHSFTQAEIEAMARPGHRLPGTMGAMDATTRSAVAAGLKTLMTPTVVRMLSYYAWVDSARRIEASLHPERSMSRGRGEGLSLL